MKVKSATSKKVIQSNEATIAYGTAWPNISGASHDIVDQAIDVLCDLGKNDAHSKAVSRPQIGTKYSAEAGKKAACLKAREKALKALARMLEEDLAKLRAAENEIEDAKLCALEAASRLNEKRRSI